MTPTRRKHLEWIRKHEPVGLFPSGGSGPRLPYVKRLLREGDVEEAGREPGRGWFALTLYRLTDQGRSRLADVAEALSREKYGKPRFRAPAGRGDPVDAEPHVVFRRRGCARPGAGGAEVGSEPGSPRSHGPTERGEPASDGDRLFPDPLEHLTEKQRKCLLAISREEKQGMPPISGPELSGILGHAPYWAQPALIRLRKAGLIAKSRPGRLGGWVLTDPGRTLVRRSANAE